MDFDFTAIEIELILSAFQLYAIVEMGDGRSYIPHIPIIHFSDPILQLYSVVPAQIVQLGGICKFEHSTVRFFGIEIEFTPEADDPLYRFGEFSDRDVYAGADIDMGVAHFSVER